MEGIAGDGGGSGYFNFLIHGALGGIGDGGSVIGDNIAGVRIGDVELNLLPHGVEGIDLAGKADVVRDVSCAEPIINGIVSTVLAPADDFVAGLGEAGAIGQDHLIIELDVGLIGNRAGTAVGVIVNGGNIQGRIIREDGLDTNDILAVFRQSAHGSGVHSKGRAQAQISAVRELPAHQRLTVRGIGNRGGCDSCRAVGIARAGNGLYIAVAIEIEDGEGVGADHLPGSLDVDMLYLAPAFIFQGLVNVGIRNTGAHDISFLGSVGMHNVPTGERGNILAVFHPYRGSSIHGLVEVQPEGRTLSGRQGGAVAVDIQVDLVAVRGPTGIDGQVVGRHLLRSKVKGNLAGFVLVPALEVVAVPGGNRVSLGLGDIAFVQDLSGINNIVRYRIFKFNGKLFTLVIDVKCSSERNRVFCASSVGWAIRFQSCVVSNRFETVELLSNCKTTC